MFEEPRLEDILADLQPKSKLGPSAITQEMAARFVPPGAPPGGVDENFEPSPDQINPRSMSVHGRVRVNSQQHND